MYVIDQLAQRWSTNPKWILEECDYAMREFGITLILLESDATAKRHATTSNVPMDGRESYQSIVARRKRERNNT